MSNYNVFISFSVVIIAGVIVTRFADRKNFPRTIPLVITGIILVAINTLTQGPFLNFSDIHEITLLVAEIALIIVLFKEGMHLNLRAIKEYFGTILTIATVGTIVNTFIIGFIATVIFSSIALIFSLPETITLSLALLIGAIFTPTDPAATFSILRGGGTRVKEKFETLLGGESSLNDVFAILLVSVIFIPLVASEVNSIPYQFDIVEISLLIIWQFLGGIAIGFLIGFIALRIVIRLKNQLEESFVSLSALALIFAVGYMTETSAAIAALTAGIVLANPSLVKQSEYFKIEMFRFWDGITWIIEIFAFIMVGALFSIQEIEAPIIIFSLIISCIVIVARFGNMFFITSPLELSESTKEHFSTSERLFVSFAGMKGLTTAILALMAYIALADGSLEIVLIMNSTIMVLIVTGLFQGMFLRPFAAKTNVVEDSDEIGELTAERIVFDAKLEFLVEEYSKGAITAIEFRTLSIPLKEQLIDIKERIIVLRSEDEQQHKHIHLSEEQNKYVQKVIEEAKQAGEIDDFSFRAAVKTLKQEEENLKHARQLLKNTNSRKDSSE